MKENSLTNKFKTLEKLINSGYNTDEKIKNMKINDIFEINNITSIDIQNIKDLMKAIKHQKVLSLFDDVKGGK